VAASKYKERGDLLEDIVASLHEFPGILVRKRVRLPVPSSTRGRKREVDVLLSQEIAGYPGEHRNRVQE
jgi:hypothetical protein